MKPCNRLLLNHLVLALGLASLMATPVLTAHGESLFRASATYTAPAIFTPSSLFTQPIPRSVGDLVTILVDDNANMTTNASLEVKRNQAVGENSSGLLNRVIHQLGVPQRIAFPDLNGSNASNQLKSEAKALRQNRLTDTITCQVVQVLPNGALVVQGAKSVLINKDETQLLVTGIVNPYYLDENNRIASSQVGNFRAQVGGRGVITRQQNDGMLNKLLQLFN
ncbi:MAG: flagellar basal body L-ring protein FlgH [Vampirovibrionales bacterium]|nr:flagellar basal body L-ring protein FlgH [Vampirovibrionales bacterium]